MLDFEPFLNIDKDHNGRTKSLTYAPQLGEVWMAKRAYRAIECDVELCHKCDGEGCVSFIELGLRVLHNVDREYRLNRKTGCIKSTYCGVDDMDAVPFCRLHEWVGDRVLANLRFVAGIFEFDLTPKLTQKADVRKLNSERRQQQVCAYVAPLTKQVNQAKAKLREQRCISQAHAVAQYKHFARKGINAAITCDGGTYVVKWEDNAC